jgi:secondary thiamine-phosphate synthase enzyme
MLEQLKIVERSSTGLQVCHRSIHLHTTSSPQFIDLTDRIMEIVEASGIQHGFVNVQTRHTTTAIIVNEAEPLLLEDMKKVLERIAPRDAEYQHNDFAIRTVNLEPFEQPNGHAHCQAIFLGTSETLNIWNGELQLGRWQRIFFIELDSARKRSVSVTVLGQAAKDWP